MNHIPDIITLLCLDAKLSLSSFGGQHRTILISKDFSNISDHVFNSLLMNFSRKDPNTPILLVSLSHDWSNYSGSAAKCGFNLRRSTNGGNIQVLDVMDEALKNIIDGKENLNLCSFILNGVMDFIDQYTPDKTNDLDLFDPKLKPINVFIDDISLLSTLGHSTNEIYKVITKIDSRLRERSKGLDVRYLSHIVLQGMMLKDSTMKSSEDLNFLIANLENICDISMILKPLETGYSTRVDGTIKILDNRSPAQPEALTPTSSIIPSLFPTLAHSIGVKKAYFFKLGDRRVRLTSSALLF